MMSTLAPSFLRRATAALPALALLVLAGTASAAPDLVIESLGVSPTSGRNGTSVSIAVRVKNQGNLTAAASTTRVRINLSDSGVESTDLGICPSIPTPVLAAGASADVGCTPKLNGRPPGPNYLWAIADVNDESGQTDKTNDRRSALFTVNDDAPDLVVQSLTVSPSLATNGETVTVTIVVANQGDAPALSSVTRVRINQDASSVGGGDQQICNLVTPTIAVASTAQVSCQPAISGRPAGVNFIWAIADVNQTAGQLDTTNDRRNAPIEIAAQASDLVVDSVVLSATGGPNGKPVNVTATIRNQGTATSFPSVTRIRMNQDPDNVGGSDAQICDNIQTPSISVGSVYLAKCKATFTDQPAGPSFIWAVADSTDSAGQSDRTNDRAKAEFLVDLSPAPDLAIAQISVNPTSAANGSSITITARVANNGDANSPTTKTRFFLNQSADTLAEDDTVLCDGVTTVALGSGAYQQVKCTTTLSDRPAGPHFVWAKTDAEVVSTDRNPDNDALSAPLTVLAEPAPDLVIETLAPNPASGASGTVVSLVARVRNQGNAAAAASTLRIRRNDSAETVSPTDPVLCDAVATPALPAGAALDVACSWTVAPQGPGLVHLWATTDVGDTAGQVVRSNDNTHSTFLVLPSNGPDLLVKRLVVRPSSARRGEPIIVKARIFNIGNVTASASFTRFRINDRSDGVDASDDVLCAAVVTQALAPGASVRARCRAIVPERPIGPNFIWATADAATTSGQVNPTNDSRGVAFTVRDDYCADPLTSPVLTWPVEQPRVIQDYASYGSVPLTGGARGYHSGMDLISHLPIPAVLTPVYAAAAGEVVAVQTNCPSPAIATATQPTGLCAAGWGNYVVIRHGNGVSTVYAHLGEVFVRNDCVAQGTLIGVVGSSGSTIIPPHLHFDVLSDMPQLVTRRSLGNEYYTRFHPADGHTPETPSGDVQVHLDPRDFMTRTRVRLREATSASRGSVTGGALAFLARGQQYISWGELVPGRFCLELPYNQEPEFGPPYGDDVRYGWVDATSVQVLEIGIAPSSVRVDGERIFSALGIGASFAAMGVLPEDGAAQWSKAWGGQHFAPTGSISTTPGTGALWLGVDAPGTSASGTGKAREVWLPARVLGAP